MDKETLDHLELCIFSEQTHDINFHNIAKELFREVYFQKNIVEQLTNNWNELRQHIKEYLEEWENSDDEWVKGKCDMARDILYDMQEIKEQQEEFNDEMQRNLDVDVDDADLNDEIDELDYQMRQKMVKQLPYLQD